MYLQTNSKETPCHGFNLDPQNPVFYGLSENPILTGDNELTLCRDDGFQLFTCTASDFARVIFADGTLTLTNEPESTPELTPPEPTTEEILLELSADQEYRLCLIELGLL